jgi:hypothetical protein
LYLSGEVWIKTGKEMTPAKAQSAPSSEKKENIFSLRSWRLGGKENSHLKEIIRGVDSYNL